MDMHNNTRNKKSRSRHARHDATVGHDRHPLDMMLYEIAACAPRKKEMTLEGWNPKRRDTFRSRWGFSVPSRRAVDGISNFARDSRILDIGCGRGTWSALLTLAGCKVVSCDSFEDYDIAAHECMVNPVVADGSTFVSQISTAEDVLMLCWPPFWNSMAEDSLQAFRGDRLVYIGERWGGCTATDGFFDLLEAGWSIKKSISLKNFWPISDSVMMFVRSS
jgi:hypothetical protein